MMHAADNQLEKDLKFGLTFRRHQQMMLDHFERLREASRKKKFKFHLVSPPGSGKTVIGIEMAIRLGKPVLVVCPNTAIQGQWSDKIQLFLSNDIKTHQIVSTEISEIRLINIFTYQMLSVPLQDEAFVRVSENLWAESYAEQLGVSPEEALLRIDTLHKNNPADYKRELTRFNRKLRQQYLNDPNVSISSVLHPNAILLIDEMKKKGVSTVIFDECHHLQSYWALTMREMVGRLRAQNIIGLTATPPLDEDREKLECYTALLGEVDYFLPTPAVVREGMLAPYQDLVHFCMPTYEEMKYVTECHAEFKAVVEEFDQKDCHFFQWILVRIVERKLITGEKQEWCHFISRRPAFAAAGVRYLMRFKYRLPWDITLTQDMYEALSLEDWMALLEDYALNCLKVSPLDSDHTMYLRIRDSLRKLGFLLTETGIRSHSAPLDRILSYSRSKLGALKTILHTEMEAMGDKVRIAILTDYEIAGAQVTRTTEGLLDTECGGAVSVMKALTGDAVTDKLDPVMITAKNLICDDDSAAKFIEEGLEWAAARNLEITLCMEQADKWTDDRNEKAAVHGFVSIIGGGRDWNSQTAVLMTTALFEKGVTRCMIGTRGLLSEGWDSLSLNTLIDMTAVTTFASVNQLRGRCIRQNDEHPPKVSNVWDIICIAPGLEKGYNDLKRLYRKHDQYYGICDDGQIQKGINHLDPAIDMNCESMNEENIHDINARMLEACKKRGRAWQLWQVGAPFRNVEMGCCELHITRPIRMKTGSVFGDTKLQFRGKVNRFVLTSAGTLLSLIGAGALVATTGAISLPALALPLGAGCLSYAGMRDVWGYGREHFFSLALKDGVMDIARCLLRALKECELMDAGLDEEKIHLSSRSDGTLRAFLDAGTEAESELFACALSQIFAPVENQRYAIARYEATVPNAGAARMLYLIRFGLDKYPPVLKGYHPLPDVFNIKEKAVIFQKHWNTLVSPGDVVFLKGDNGKRIIETYGRINILGAKRGTIKVWL